MNATHCCHWLSTVPAFFCNGLVDIAEVGIGCQLAAAGLDHASGCLVDAPLPLRGEVATLRMRDAYGHDSLRRSVGSWPVADSAARLAGRLVLDDERPSAIVYDLARLEARAMELRTALPGFQHCLALKASPYAAILQRYAGWGFGFEAASFTEGLVAHHAAPGATVLFDSPAKSRTEIARAQALGWLLSANSLQELERMDAPCALRINTLVGAGRIAHTSVCDARSRFGVRLDELPDDLRCEGWHAHVGSQGGTIDQLVMSARRLVDLAQRRPGTRWINLGGGMPVEADYGSYGRALRAAVPELFEGHWTVYTEMGRSLLGGCARAYSRVEYAHHGVATIHLGADFLLRRVYRPQDWDCPMRALSPDFAPRTGLRQLQTIAGPLCFAGDLLGEIDAPTIAEGDIVEIGLAGAYTLSMWSRHCSRRMPPVYGLDAADDLQLISAGESEADLLRLWRVGGVA
ncbi:MAG: diaminopimelate decarboxylase [Pseudomonadota bacterium]|nr:diaminopimelate decarboxylase [Pseudomonadota bacterium]